jgi:S-adenosylmethionine/arginine decarboxylase-like enzyme
MPNTLQHFLVELHDCEVDRAADEKYLEKILKEATNEKPINSLFHKAPDCIVGWLLLENMRLVIHSFFSKKYVGVDLYFTTEKIDIQKILSFIIRKLGATKYSVSKINRGN